MNRVTRLAVPGVNLRLVSPVNRIDTFSALSNGDKGYTSMHLCN